MAVFWLVISIGAANATLASQSTLSLTVDVGFLVQNDIQQ